MFNPEVKVVKFDVADVITVSGGCNPDNASCDNELPF